MLQNSSNVNMFSERGVQQCGNLWGIPLVCPRSCELLSSITEVVTEPGIDSRHSSWKWKDTSLWPCCIFARN